jgi:hypothetical protein
MQYDRCCVHAIMLLRFFFETNGRSSASQLRKERIVLCTGLRTAERGGKGGKKIIKH